MIKIIRDMKLRSKFMLSYVAIILFVVLMISVVNYKLTESTLKNNTSIFSQYLLEQMGSNLETRARDIKDFVSVQFDKSGIARQLVNIKENKSDFDILIIRRGLYNLLYFKQYVKSVMIIDKYDQRFSSEKEGVYVNYNKLYESVGKNKIKELRGSVIWKYGDENTVYMMKALYDIETTNYVGIIVIGIDNSYFTKIFENIDNIKGGRIVILNSENEIFVANDLNSLNIANIILKNDDFEDSKKSINFNYKEKQYISTLELNPNGKWKILNIISVEELTEDSKILRTWIIFTCIIAFAIAFIVAILMSKNITENIRILVKNIKKISEGDFYTHIKTKNNDEVGMIAKEVNLMTEKINDLINRVYNEQLLKKSAQYKALQFEYSALQAQINPHFLYNTLETINSMAKLKGEEETSEMVYLLGNLLRETISKKSRIISLNEELKYIKNYLKIQKIIYGDRIEVKYKIDQSLLETMLPKFILQPIVENAIVHGIENKRGKGEITINCFRDSKDIILEVIDNGIGIDNDEVKAILRKEKNEEKHSENSEKGYKHTKVGIKSVDKRIKIIYGDNYGLEIESKKGEGTKIIIKIPYK